MDAVRESQIAFHQKRLDALKVGEPLTLAEKLGAAEAKLQEAERELRVQRRNFESATITVNFHYDNFNILKEESRTNTSRSEAQVVASRKTLEAAEANERRVRAEVEGLRSEINEELAKNPALIQGREAQARLVRAGIAAAESVWHARAIDFVDAIAKVSEIVNREVEVVAITNVQLRSAGLPESMRPYLSSLLALGTPRMLAESLAAFPPDYQRARAFLDKLTEEAASLAQ